MTETIGDIDIVERLRFGVACPVSGVTGDLAKDMADAADEIDRLRTVLAAQPSVSDAEWQALDRAHALVERVERSRQDRAARLGLEAAGAAGDKPSPVEAAGAAPPAQQWLPMDSAPKDGSELLLVDADGVRVVGLWAKHNHVPIYGWIRQVELYGEEVDGFDAVGWQPLPAAPQHQGGGK